MTNRAWLWAGLVVGIVWTAVPATAQESDPPNVVEAREHLRQGTALLDQENYDGALAEFERAYQLVGDHPARYLILFNIARAHERRFRYDLALQYYQRYLDEGGPNAEHRTEVEVTMRTLEGLLATVDIESNVPAEVWVDDRMIGNAPGPVRVASGRHVVELRAQGYAEARQELQIAARETRSMSFTLSELGEGFTGLDPLFFGIATGLAAVVALVGGGFGIAAMMRRGDVDAQLADEVEMWDGESLEAARGEIQAYALTADILYGTAGLFAVTAAVLAFLTNFGGSTEETEAGTAPALAPFAGPGLAGLSLSGGF